MLAKWSSPLAAYARWLHLRWPAGIPEALPEAGEDGLTAVAGIRIAGDLLGLPLLKFAADSGTRAVRAFAKEGAFNGRRGHDVLDLVIIGGGVAGLSAALEAQKLGLDFMVYEASEWFSTIANFTEGKPIFTYPRTMQPAGDVRLTATSKEGLLTDLLRQAQKAAIPYQIRRVDSVTRSGGYLDVRLADTTQTVRARRVLVCTGKSGDHHRLGVPGEALDKVHNRLFDPNDYRGKDVLVVGGGDTALETAISLHDADAHVHLSYRGTELARPKPETVQKARAMLGDRILYGTQVKEILPDSVVLDDAGGQPMTLANEAVFVQIGRKAPVEFLNRLGLAMRGQWGMGKSLSLLLMFALTLFIYGWKSEGSTIGDWFLANEWFPNNIDATDPRLPTVLQAQANSPGFYYEVLYTLVIAVFGVRRILRFPTPYIRYQTLSLMLFQAVPLFLLPYVILPLLGGSGVFDEGAGAWLADQLFPLTEDGSREYWRSVGFILAWPLFIWNVFTEQPNWMWLGIACLQTFVIIPWLVYRYGKGVYCGWICSCGALAETLGDAHRSKMPHGPVWNRVNMAGQVILALVFGLLLLRIAGWMLHGSPNGEFLSELFAQLTFQFKWLGIPLNYAGVVDYFLAGIIGLGLYFHFSGRTWCRFFCPLAALMNIYARFSQFRIFAEKDKCISCAVCTTVCHQGIDVMNFANKGQPMADPQCVRCSACVTQCPTGTLSFGRLRPDGTVMLDTLPASPVQIREQGR